MWWNPDGGECRKAISKLGVYMQWDQGEGTEVRLRGETFYLRGGIKYVYSRLHILSPRVC